MSFNIGLSALNAAQQEISVTGNNIANSGTNGFKAAKTVFGDVYAASVLGGGGTQSGSGVTLQEIKQSFTQGNISFTQNTLDLAINGEGFFVLKGESGIAYSRAGAFGTDRNGFIVNSDGEKIQGFAPSAAGNATGGGPLTDLRVTTGEIQPRPTTSVKTIINLDAATQPSAVIGSTLTLNQGRSTAPILMDALDPRDNGYQSNTIEVIGADRQLRRITVPANSSANQVAEIFAGASGVAAQGTTVAFITNITAGPVAPATARFAINGREFEVDPADPDAFNLLANSINNANTNVSARVVNGALQISHDTGADLNFTSGSVGNGTITVSGSEKDTVTGDPVPVGATAVANFNGTDVIVVGGSVEFTLDEDVVLRASSVDADGNPIDQTLQIGSIFGDISQPDALDGQSFITNTFDPKNPETYYRSTAITIYDTVGTQHSLAMYFVKERPNETGDTNLWSAYFQVDGRDIGFDPNSQDGLPVPARYDLKFDDTGRFDPNQLPIEITNWYPVDSAGRRIGAGPVPGDPNVSDLLNNSNFKIDLTGMTAFGGDFSVQENDQDGFAKGQLTGLEVNTRGLISARFSNGQSRVLGEVALANFANTSGLANLGGSKFAETSESGAASVSGAGTAGLGAIQSGALEDSNVDLPTELVQLIISQRNYQAAAQIISATDDATQTIINL
ncbi:flagellar hook-basal body complex protein [Gammaproteobacteria bacterium LSUCC0112]|nr:flagellar hook-basal body complex protein [Gammaproteobacteria bacterium LSUCC0112]